MSAAGYDYIVIGSGAGGSVVAARLSEDAASSVLLIEEGPHDDILPIRAAGGFYATHGTSRTFLFETEPEPTAGNRRLSLIAGRTLGGGTSINGLCYSRGQWQDYDDWATAGCKGWSFEEVLPWFRKSEANTRLSNRHHGVDGPMKVSDGAFRHELTHAFVRAAQETRLPSREANIPFNHDFNADSQEGAGYYQTMSWRGERCSTARAFLAQAAARPNLTIRTDTSATRIVFDGRRAVGVAVRGKAGKEEIVKAGREIVLSAGTFHTPRLLMLSGVGPGADLQRHGIETIFDSPNVGRNYQDHMHAPFEMALKDPIGLIGHYKGLKTLWTGLQWLLLRTGPLSSNVVEAGCFLDMDGDGRPELQLNAIAGSGADWGGAASAEHRFSLSPMCLTCRSRGTVSLRSADPADMPAVRTNFLQEEDLATLVGGIAIARLICAAPSLSGYFTREALPGSAIGADRSDVDDWVRGHARAGLHATSTCAMGAGADAVTDLELRVRGVGGLRIADGSAIPLVPRGNTAAPIMMVGERCAGFIRGRQAAP